MKNAHTPGPWVAPPDQVNLVCRKADWESREIGTLVNGFQCLVSLKQGEDKARADARLIACAPTLLKGLKLALLEFERISYQKKADPEIIALMKKAIAMAEGRP